MNVLSANRSSSNRVCARRVSSCFRVGAEGIHIDADLIGNEREQRSRRMLVDAQESAWLPHHTELHGKAESILFAATRPHELQVFVAEQVVLGELRLASVLDC